MPISYTESGYITPPIASPREECPGAPRANRTQLYYGLICDYCENEGRLVNPHYEHSDIVCNDCWIRNHMNSRSNNYFDSPYYNYFSNPWNINQ